MKFLFCAVLVVLILRGTESRAQEKVFSSEKFGVSELKTNVLVPLDKDFTLTFNIVYPSEKDKGSFKIALLNPKNSWSKFPAENSVKFPITIFEIDNNFDESDADPNYSHTDFFDTFTSKHIRTDNLPVINLNNAGSINAISLSWKKCDERIILNINGELKISGKQNLESFFGTKEAMLVFWNEAGKEKFTTKVSNLNLAVSNPETTPINLGSDGYFTGNPIRLDAGGNFDSYSWNSGTTIRYAAVTKAGVYSVKATKGNGCESTDTIVFYTPGTPNADKLIADSAKPKTNKNLSSSTNIKIDLTAADLTKVNKPKELIVTKTIEPEKTVEKSESLIAAVGILTEMFEKVSTDTIGANLDNATGFVLKNVNFNRGSSKLLPESYEELDKLADFLKKYTNLKIRINGHTDITGDPFLNMELSENRANSVRKYLFDQGVQYSRIETKGFGSTKPLGTFAQGSGKNPNMRVEFEIFE